MENHKSKVVIMYLLWSKEPYEYLEDAIEGVKQQTYPKELLEFLIVYNSHKPDEPSAASYIQETIAKHAAELPHVTILDQETNLGFSGGNNLGMQWGIDHGYDYVFLHNGDAYLGERCVEELVSVMDKDRAVGAAQALVLLHPEKDLINTAGNSFHYLGVGYCDLYRVKKTDAELPATKDVGYLSGAAVMMRTQLLKEHGLWDDDYFMYHEDTDYSFRLKILGYKTVMVRDAEFFHKYKFSKSIQKYYWMERNRRAIMLLYFKWPTLLLLLPMEIVVEFGKILFAIKGGWAKELFRVYAYWLKPSSWKLWLAKRKKIQVMRKMNDRGMLKNVVSTIEFQEPEMQNPLLRYIGNPLMAAYWWVAKRVIFW